jgi:hypothetical protein
MFWFLIKLCEVELIGIFISKSYYSSVSVLYKSTFQLIDL